jgi:dihydroorotate dehydrogenase (fumarate)
MDLTTHYLGFTLPHPLIAGASPMGRDRDALRRLEDAGIAAIVMPSLFEEELLHEQLATAQAIEEPAESYAEATTYFPTPPGFQLGPDQYLKRLAQVKELVSVPVFGSLNGVTPGGWSRYAQAIEQAGADALELNLYNVVTDPNRPGREIEGETLELVREVRGQLTIPLTVKLSPFYTSLPNFAQQLVDIGADGLVLFNRFYQPDLDVEQLEVVPSLRLSNSSELLLRLHWLAILSGRVDAALAVTGGVHSATDVVKAVMCGASGVQVVSELLQHGPMRISAILDELQQWLEEHEYGSLQQMLGSMNLTRCPDPQAYERTNYMRLLNSWNTMQV